MNKPNQAVPKLLIAAALHSSISGKEVGPYFLGISFEAIQKKYEKKLSSHTLELLEIGIERVRTKPGFKKAEEIIKTGEHSAYMFT